MIGHSMGETACAFADGLMTEEQTILASYWRGRCTLNGNPPPGCMASVGMYYQASKHFCNPVLLNRHGFA
ncbi:Fatty acid synthase [Holothuria leucospilota]|uniref:Fatty acid synthase n=1 Tax=Holothuria leucospilota TaxID=206669 RepID=A0A9Q1BPJ1_HOLLE|nr:Fatty acid synthase [Holothuria leucospilota]